ncbi:hypothetical protein SAMN05216389_104169 [Oceanobacillus limi]|uniref:Uncharacterized protein n=1 Tax=Oceanobacillus limi TaxID=930131 RepID=A0A1I0B5Z0_9BACI|nr:hypothetical protein [Oceanobacillus limi]SET01419.1 hypothetical protein SAMN05216389_104169 [Oceanobacillus limi]
MKFHSKILIGLSVIIIFSVFFTGGITVSAANNGESDLTEKMKGWENQGIDPNHSEVIEEIRMYIESNFDPEVFASLHIDREKRALGTIVISFTEQPANEKQKEMEALLDEHAEIEFQKVDFTENELVQKQKEVDKNEFGNGETFVTHTSVDIITNRVEVGIDPYNEETVASIYKKYGDEKVIVVEGKQATALNDMGENELVERNDRAKEGNWVERLITSISRWVKNIF